MPLTTIPAIDANICSGWTEQQINLFNKLDFYLAKLQTEQRKTWAVWTNSPVIGKVRWQPNMGDIMRGVRKEPSPHLRQFAFPSTLRSGVVKKDVIDVRELKAEVEVRRHRFETPVMNFLPDFRDFMTDHVDYQGKDLEEKKIRFEDVFYRTQILYRSPYVWFPDRAGGELQLAPMEDGNAANDAAQSKNTTYWQGNLPLIGNPGNLSLNTLNIALTTMEVDLRVPAFRGSGQPGENNPPPDKYLLICSSEAWNQFIYDPWLLANKNCDLNVITEGFKGSLFGRIVARLEDRPLRIAADGTFPQVEYREIEATAYNVGESLVTTEYKDAPYEVAFLCGMEGYKRLEVGPPPKVFASKGMPEGFGKMFWNGEIMVTKNLIITCEDNEGNVSYEPNNYGEYLKFISQLTLGIVGQQPRNILPIPFKRRRGANP
jgi:hypothetical protein